MITVTCEVRRIDETGSHLMASSTDVPINDEPIAITLMRTAALTADAVGAL